MILIVASGRDNLRSKNNNPNLPPVEDANAKRAAYRRRPVWGAQPHRHISAGQLSIWVKLLKSTHTQRLVNRCCLRYGQGARGLSECSIRIRLDPSRDEKHNQRRLSAGEGEGECECEFEWETQIEMEIETDIEIVCRLQMLRSLRNSPDSCTVNSAYADATAVTVWEPLCTC